MLLCKIEVYSHFFKVYQVQARMMEVVRQFSRGLIQHKLEKVNGRFQKKAERVYAASTFDRFEFRFNRNQFEEFLDFAAMSGIQKHHLEITYIPLYAPKTVDVSLAETWKPRENQVGIIDYIVSDGHIKVVTLQTGQGKTSCGLKAGEILGTRLGIVVLGRFFEKWISDVKGQYRLKNDDILAIRGYKQLKEILWCLATEPLEAKVVIITSTTIQDYIAHYEGSRFKDQEPWLVPPEKLWEKLGVGFRIIDEAHMHFHLNFCIDLYTHIPKGLYLSATLEPDDPFVDKMYRIAYPMATRVNGGAYIKYCDVTAIGYRLAFWQKARTKGYGGSYSHSAFEEWLMKKEKPLKNYLDLIHTVVDTEYLRKREPGQKMLIFAYTVDLCKLIRDDLKRRPDLKGVSIEKYTSEDPYSVIQGNDIVITTLGSAGTAIDIPGLLCCLMTTSISATQANLQALGRLREMHAWPNSKPHFLYLYCLELTKQVEYHEKKKRIFNGRVLSHREIEAPKVI